LYNNFYFFPPTFLKELAGAQLNSLIRNESKQGKKRQKEKRTQDVPQPGSNAIFSLILECKTFSLIAWIKNNLSLIYPTCSTPLTPIVIIRSILLFKDTHHLIKSRSSLNYVAGI
jgi:hypothetical protein